MIDHLDDVPVSEPSYPVLVKRVQSTFIDFLIIVVLMLLASLLLNAIGDEKDTPTWINVVLFLGIWGLYEPLAVGSLRLYRGKLSPANKGSGCE